MSATTIYNDIQTCLKRGERIAVATVVKTIGAAPCGVGTKMLVRADGTTSGSFSGAKVDAQVAQDALQALREGHVDGLVIQDPYRMGYLGVWTVVQALEGYDVSADGKELYTGEFIMTKKNMDDPEIRGKFDPDYQANRTIKTPKYKKK